MIIDLFIPKTLSSFYQLVYNFNIIMCGWIVFKKCRWFVFNCVDELSQKPCRWVVLSMNCLVPKSTSRISAYISNIWWSILNLKSAFPKAYSDFLWRIAKKTNFNPRVYHFKPLLQHALLDLFKQTSVLLIDLQNMCVSGCGIMQICHWIFIIERSLKPQTFHTQKQTIVLYKSIRFLSISLLQNVVNILYL